MSGAGKRRRIQANQPSADTTEGTVIDNQNSNATNTAEEDSDSEAGSLSWIQWFCRLKGNKFFCEVDEEYIEDSFNLFGLSKKVPLYDEALKLITEEHYMDWTVFIQEQNDAVINPAAEMLYGLIHARYILTDEGLAKMRKKFLNAHFGRCPRVYCRGQRCLPVGEHDIRGSGEARIYCPKCKDIYASKCQINTDGAYFGKTFPHLFLMKYKDLKPAKARKQYVPRVFGFKIHKPRGHD